MKPFEIEVQHSAETVSDLTRAQYALSHKTARLIQVVTAVVCLLIGVHAIGSVVEPFNYFFSLYGCLAIVFINVPASSLAEFQAFLSSRTGKPCQTLYPWLSASLWSIIRQKKAGADS